MKLNLFISDDAWEGLKQKAFETNYIRGIARDDRPRGMSAFIGMICMLQYQDARPEYMRGTGQWITGIDTLRQRCLELDGGTVSDLGLLALQHGIYTYKSQLPVANGFRREAVPPLLHAPGATPRGGSSVVALAGPVLDAIGLGYLAPVAPFPQAPPNLYQGPSQRYTARESKRRRGRSMF